MKMRVRGYTAFHIKLKVAQAMMTMMTTTRGCDSFNKNFQKFRFATKWIGKMRSTLRSDHFYGQTGPIETLPFRWALPLRFGSPASSRPKRWRRQAFSPAKRMFPRFTRRQTSKNYFHDIFQCQHAQRYVLCSSWKRSSSCSCQVERHVSYCKWKWIVQVNISNDWAQNSHM